MWHNAGPDRSSCAASVAGQQRDVLPGVAHGELRAHRRTSDDLALLNPAGDQARQLRPAGGDHLEKTAHDAFALFVEFGVLLPLQHRRDEVVLLFGIFDLESDLPTAGK